MKKSEAWENRCAAFKESETRRSSTSPTKDAPQKGTPSNPYERAFTEIFNGYPDWRKRELKELMDTKQTDSRHYTDFIRLVAELGDKYSQ